MPIQDSTLRTQAKPIFAAASSYQPASTVGLKAFETKNADRVQFSGKKNTKTKPQSEVPDILPKKSWLEKIKDWFSSLAKWLNPLYVIQRMMAFFNERQAKKVIQNLEKLTPEKMQAYMNEPPLDKISYESFKRPSTGISKASQTFTADHPVMQGHKDWTYLHILEDYGIQWSRFKVTRDAMQNFYDGQGQTLDGVKVDVQPQDQGQHKVKINASANYDVDKLLALGGTGKKGEESAAGGFGEGAKMMALVLLRDYGVKTVTFRSCEWQAEFKLDHPGKAHATKENVRGLMVKLTPLEKPIEGNELEFTTSDESLAETFKGGEKLFYNPKNPIFQHPTYENESGGFKLLEGSKAPGRVYEAGQLRAFGTEGNYDAIPGLAIWSNKKMLDLFDRDRTAIQKYDAERILKTVVGQMSLEETKQGILSLRKLWFHQKQKPEDLVQSKRNDANEAANMLLQAFCEHYKGLANLKPDFLSDGLVAVSSASLAGGGGLLGGLMGGEEESDPLNKLYEAGYIPVHPALEYLGVPSGDSLLASELASKKKLQEDKVTRLTDLTPRQQRQLDVLKEISRVTADTLQRQASVENNSYTKRRLTEQGQELSKIANSPFEMVKLPEGSTEPFKLSQDKSKILVDATRLETMRFKDAYTEMIELLQTEIRTRWYDNEQTELVLDALAPLQQVKTKWTQKD